jgi:hypothetical protein
MSAAQRKPLVCPLVMPKQLVLVLKMAAWEGHLLMTHLLPLLVAQLAEATAVAMMLDQVQVVQQQLMLCQRMQQTVLQQQQALSHPLGLCLILTMCRNRRIRSSSSSSRSGEFTLLALLQWSHISSRRRVSGCQHTGWAQQRSSLRLATARNRCCTLTLLLLLISKQAQMQASNRTLPAAKTAATFLPPLALQLPIVVDRQRRRLWLLWRLMLLCLTVMRLWLMGSSSFQHLIQMTLGPLVAAGTLA